MADPVQFPRRIKRIEEEAEVYVSGNQTATKELAGKRCRNLLFSKMQFVLTIGLQLLAFSFRTSTPNVVLIRRK